MARRGRTEATAAGDTEPKVGRGAQLRQAYTMARKSDPRIALITLGVFLAVFVVITLLGLLLGHVLVFGVLGLVLGLLVAFAIFGRRAQRAAYSQVADTPGVAVSVIERMRGDWRVTPAVQMTRDYDLVHRVLGKHGVLLVAEGNARGKGLVAAEGKRLRKVVGDTPVTVISIGSGPDDVPLDKLQLRMMRLPHVLKSNQVDVLHRRIAAMPASNTAVGLPKGPMPTRVPKGARR